MNTKNQQIKLVNAAWAQIAYVLNNISWHAYGDKYLAENVAEEKGHRGFCAGRNDYGLTVAQSAKLFAVRQIAEYLNGGKLPEIRDYIACRKSVYTAASLVENYRDKLSAALADYDLNEIIALDYAKLVKTA